MLETVLAYFEYDFNFFDYCTVCSTDHFIITVLFFVLVFS